MAGTWIIGTFLTNLATNLRARLATAGETSVKVFTAPMAADDDSDEAIAFISIEDDEETAALGARPSHAEARSVLRGILGVFQGIAADGAIVISTSEAAAVAARTRALAILAYIELELRTNASQGIRGAGSSDQVTSAYVSSRSLTQGINEDETGRWAIIEFAITVVSRTTVTP